MLKCLIYIALCINVSTFSVFARDISFESYNIEDGLSNSTVNTIYKSKSQLIWVGTERGVDLFTGNSFIPLEHFITDSIHDVRTSITSITEINEDKLWVGTWGNGLFCVDIKNGKYKHFRAIESPVTNSISDNYINCLHTQDNELWIGSIYGLNQTNGDGRFTHYSFEEVLTKGIPDIRGIIPKYKHLFSVFTNSGEILELNTQTGTYTKVSELNAPIGSITTIKKDKNGRYWIATGFNGVIILDENYNIIQQPTSLAEQINSSHISDITILPNGLTLLSSDEAGLFLVDPDIKTWHNIKHSSHDNNSLKSNQLQSLMFDSDSILWVGYFKNGFSKTVYNEDGINNFNKTGEEQGLLPNKNVNGFAEDHKNNIWIGTESGITILKSDLQAIKPKSIHIQTEKVLKDHPITVLHTNKQKDKIYIGTYNNGLFITDLKTNKIKNFNKENSKLQSNFIRDVKEVNDTLAYIATIDGGLYKFNGKDFEIITIYFESNFEIRDFLHINIIDRNTLWLGCIGKGVMQINTSTGSGKLFDNVISTICYSTVTTTDSCVFITTNKGIFKFKPEINDFVVIANTNQNSEYYGIIEDNEGALWISSSNGLLKYDRTNQTIKSIISINLQNREYIPGAFLKLSDGRFLFGGTNGFNIIQPGNYELQGGKPSIFLSDFKAYNQKIKPGRAPIDEIQLKHQINFTDELYIPSKVNLFSILANVINYQSYGYNKIAYTISNGNKKSELIYSDNEIDFLNLNSGIYTLTIYPVNKLNNEAYLSEGRTITIHKAKPWWQSYWLYAGTITLIFLLIIILHKVKVRGYIRTKQLLEKIVDDKTTTLLLQKDYLQTQHDELKKTLSENEKLEAFKESMISMIVHDLKNPLNGIIGLSSLNEAEYLEHINSSSRQMLYLVENILDVRRYETHSLKLFHQVSDIRQLINEALDDVRYLLKNNNIEIINLITPTQINIDKEILRRVFINLLTNAIKYSPIDGKIHLRCAYSEVKQEKSLVLSIQDEGQGIPLQYKDSIFELYQQVDKKKSGLTNSNGLGLSFCKIAVEEHNGKIWVDSELGQGSTFYIQLPIDNA